jgi:hypothetical protein
VAQAGEGNKIFLDKVDNRRGMHSMRWKTYRPIACIHEEVFHSMNFVNAIQKSLI